MKIGDIVKFKQVIEDGDEKIKMVVLEDRGDRVLVQALDMFKDWTIKPTTVYLKTELELV